ncbi:MAG: FHA domain-containing protein [Pirellulaceae bacterium]|nr:FHA domain-containing protein [Pirellulaceae bacterium]
MTSSASPSVKLQLLDSALGHPLQSWDCSALERVTIGRSKDNVVSVEDPHVSRLHVELVLEEGQWFLESRGRNGTWIQGTRVERVELGHRTIFQLGSSGPMLQILIQDAPTDMPTATLDNLQPMDFDFLNFNREQLADEVTKITETEAFQRLQSQSRHRRPFGKSSDDSDQVTSEH